MAPHPDDLTGMKDDMTAFIEGLGMRRFFGYVECEEVPSVLWDSGQNPEGWKDFVELAKSTRSFVLWDSGQNPEGWKDFVELAKSTRSFVLWDSGQNPEGWKDFVELAKSTSAAFLTMHSWVLDREEYDRLTQRLADGDYSSEEDVEEGRWLKTYIGKTGFVQLGWAYQGCMFVYEAGTEWYEHYQRSEERRVG